MASKLPRDEVQCWTSKRRVALVVSILKGVAEGLRSSCARLSTALHAQRKHGLTVAEFEDWRARFVANVENSLRSHPRNGEQLKDHEIKRLKQKVGDLVMDNEILKDALKPYRPQEGRLNE